MQALHLLNQNVRRRPYDVCNPNRVLNVVSQVLEVQFVSLVMLLKFPEVIIVQHQLDVVLI